MPLQTQDALQAGEAAWKNRLTHRRVGRGRGSRGEGAWPQGGPPAPSWNSLTLARPTQTRNPRVGEQTLRSSRAHVHRERLARDSLA
eukprot:6222867-Alexandrium_andersonii.AAC.1